MEKSKLTKEYVFNNGIDFEELWGEYCSDRILDKPEDEGGKPFTGLVYELYNTGELANYCIYKEGFLHGEYVKFYKNSTVKSVQYMKYGVISGREEIWFDNGQVKSVAEYEYGVCLNMKEWDEKGTLVKEKLELSKYDLEIINNQKKWYRSIGRI